MNEVLKIMNDDHQKLEDLFSQLLSALETNHSNSGSIFSRFKQTLQKHFIWEEKVLFHLFEKRAGLSSVDTIFVLRNEHHQINKMFVAKIENMISENRFTISLNQAFIVRRLLPRWYWELFQKMFMLKP